MEIRFTENHASAQNGQTLRFLMLNDTTEFCELVGTLMRLSSECEFDWVERGESFIQRL